MQIAQIKTAILEKLEPQLRPLIDKLLDRWESMNQREQMVVAILGVTIVFALFFSLIVTPLIKGREQARALYESRQEELSWMQGVAPQLIGKSNKEPLQNAQAMMNTVNKSAAAFQLKLNRVQPEGDTKLRVWLEKVPFNALMSWLNDLQLNNGIVSSSVNIEADSTPGVVSAKVVLQSQ